MIRPLTTLEAESVTPERLAARLDEWRRRLRSNDPAVLKDVLAHMGVIAGRLDRQVAAKWRPAVIDADTPEDLQAHVLAACERVARACGDRDLANAVTTAHLARGADLP